MKILNWFKSLWRKEVIKEIETLKEELKEELIEENEPIAPEKAEEKRLKHVHNLHPSADGSVVGVVWTEKMDKELIELLRPGITLMELSEETGRPVWGISTRLRRLGLVLNSRHYYYNYVAGYVPEKIEKVLSSEIKNTLISKGWYYKHLGTRKPRHVLYAPLWWDELNSIEKGSIWHTLMNVVN